MAQLDPRETLCAHMRSMFSSLESGVHDDLLESFITPTNLSSFTGLYGRHLVRNIPILHGPSFQVIHVHVILLAAIMVAGSCFADERVSADMINELAIGLLKVIQNQPVNSPVNQIGLTSS